jgi:hypothetical protein
MSGTPELPPLGEKTASVILALLQDLYRQEVGAAEDVHSPEFAWFLSCA